MKRQAKRAPRFFHGYYGHYCYLPLYIFCGEFVLGARLRPSNLDASTGSVEELKRIVKQIRAQASFAMTPAGSVHIQCPSVTAPAC